MAGAARVTTGNPVERDASSGRSCGRWRCRVVVAAPVSAWCVASASPAQRALGRLRDCPRDARRGALYGPAIITFSCRLRRPGEIQGVVHDWASGCVHRDILKSRCATRDWASSTRCRADVTFEEPSERIVLPPDRHSVVAELDGLGVPRETSKRRLGMTAIITNSPRTLRDIGVHPRLHRTGLPCLRRTRNQANHLRRRAGPAFSSRVAVPERRESAVFERSRHHTGSSTAFG